MRYRSVASAMALVLLPAMMGAQAPSAALQAAYSGSWTYDSTQSDAPVTPNIAVEPKRGDPAAAVGGAPTRGSGGGGSGRRGGGGGAGGAPPPSAGMGQRAGAGAGMRNRYVRELLAQLNTPATMVLTAGATEIAIATVDGTIVTWTPDGKKRQKAMLDGSILEFAATWKGDKIELRDGVATMAALKRELKVSKDGQTLTIKLELDGSAVPKKLSRTVVYVRGG